jgi:hypothetical protein
MSWPLALIGPKDPELTDAALLAAGKALYLSNCFESGCYDILRVCRLLSYLDTHQPADWSEAVLAVSKKKLLHATIEELETFPVVGEEDVAILQKAREARNYLAHEGAFPGFIWCADTHHIQRHLETLRTTVADLAMGNHVVSGWRYEFDEQQPVGSTMALFPKLAVRWVFGD